MISVKRNTEIHITDSDVDAFLLVCEQALIQVKKGNNLDKNKRTIAQRFLDEVNTLDT